jgi:hypothetical protein
MKPVYAVGGLVALALIVLAGWFIVRATPETTTLEPVPVETAEIIAPAAESTETAVPPTEEPPLTKAPPPTEIPSLYQTYEIGEEIWTSDYADLNGDGYPDVTLADLGSNAVILLFNRGDGTFEESAQIATGENPYGLAAADLDADQDNDLVITNHPDEGNAVISILINNGDGTFQPRIDYPDVVTANAFGIVSVLLNDGNGAFPDKVDYDVGGEVWTIVSLDVTSDTYADLLIGPTGSGMASLLTNNGDGTFELAKDYYFPGIWAEDFDVIDVDLDGRLELIAFGENALHVIPLELP